MSQTKFMEKTQPLVYFLLAKKNSNIEHITFSNRENISLRSRVRGCFLGNAGLLGGLPPEKKIVLLLFFSQLLFVRWERSRVR